MRQFYYYITLLLLCQVENCEHIFLRIVQYAYLLLKCIQKARLFPIGLSHNSIQIFCYAL
ncbi:hypothetical protein RUMCAL_01093 [Ruminococcus callidus ATCC 27760]|uniref:Uncharacterized protein n=1 Tax=Ruminococcus callidus ATCC 27760 TaxID=411473 RepID=U2KWA1_9FIRM|nr:hypothetical protein RUMCAL_01093 [Ruminococcus callidus ATCC 27760]